ncbi:putative iron-dependent peroxidase [Rosellinia necatrix]|uniref:Putative iron-dependent peroxidase n=1 Tax=Rosellinia necatrix TaxID=77044 RepID=A0A1W2TWM9_ROSNE|nr:putative iron-dependent peroxidase [Rosellinia necatrix]
MTQCQAVDAGLTGSATFLVFSVRPGDGRISAVRKVLSSVPDIAKNVSIRGGAGANLSCVAGVGSRLWDALTALPRPAELHPFPEVRGPRRTAVSTPGDLLFHIRAERRDLCFEVERQLAEALGDAVRLEDRAVGFRYFDARDLLGFVDGTANPAGPEAVREAVVIPASADDSQATAVGGSYVVVQKYLHDMKAWKALSTEQQEAVIGRTKADNVEIDDVDEGRQQAHKTLATIEDADGGEHAILRDNMPFGAPSAGEFGTYFIAYSRRLWVVEKMMERMFLGNPPGLYDRILDYSTPITGSTFFVPPLSTLDALGDK